MANQGLRKRLPSKKWLSLLIMALLVLAGLSSGITAFSQAPSGDGPVAVVTVTANKIEWQPQVPHAGLILTIAGPGDLTYEQEFASGSVPTFGLADAKGQPYPDGSYTYELLVVPVVDAKLRAALEEARKSGSDGVVVKRQVQSGHFSIKDGAFVTAAATGAEWDGDGPPTEDVLHYDDVIITGSECIGFDCADGESFGFDTIILKEHNLRIYFNDTSVTGSYPTNNWRITINDSTNGGASYFSIDDVDDGTSPFKVEAGAPSNSLYVEDYGRIGIGTSTPYVEVHIKDSDTPTVRLEQDGSGGWTPQTWDVGGNESNFWIRDVTNGSKLPFRIQPNTPSSSLCLLNDGDVGIGTWSPEFPVEIERTGSNPQIYFDRTDGAKGIAGVTSNKTRFGSYSNHPVTIIVNNAKVAEFDTSGNLLIDGTLTENAWGKVKESETLRGRVTALEAQNKALEAEKATLRREVDDLKARMAALEAKVANGAAPTSGFLPGVGLLLAGLALSLPVGLVWVARRGGGASLFKR